MANLSATPENPLLWAFLMENFNLGMAKMSVIPENPLFPNPVLPKTTVQQMTQFGLHRLANVGYLFKRPTKLLANYYYPPLNKSFLLTNRKCKEWKCSLLLHLLYPL